jgi:hypothetical protein
MSELPVTPPEIKVPHWTRSTTLFSRFADAFETLYQSSIWSTGATTAAFFATMGWSHPGRRWHHVGQLKTAYLAAYALTFVLTFLCSYLYYTAPDRGIEARMREVAASMRLQLTRRANGVASDWIWTRFPSVSMDLQLRMGDHCWTLTSDRDPSGLVMVTHTARSNVHGWSRGGSSVREVAALAFFRQARPEDNALAETNTDALSVLGLKAVQTQHGVCVSVVQFCHWRKGKYALDLITVDRLASLLKVVHMSG